MISSLGRLEGLENSNVSEIQEEIEFLRDTLEVLRATDEISNDAFLEAGSIQGGLSILINLILQGITGVEANSQLSSLKERAQTLNEIYPGLDASIESKRNIP